MAFGAVTNTGEYASPGATNTIDISFTSAVTAGNLLILGFRAGDYTADLAETDPVVDGLGNTWHLIDSQVLGANNGKAWFFYADGCLGGSCTVTITLSTSAGSIRGCVYEVPSSVGSQVLDKTAKNAGTGTSIDSGATATTAQADEWIAGLICNANSAGGFDPVDPAEQIADSSANSHLLGKVVSSTGTYSATGTPIVGSCDWAAIVATFYEGGGGGTIAADAGAYAVTGAAGTLRSGRRLVAGGTNYNLNGAVALLLLPARVIAEAGAYTLLGADASLLGSAAFVLASDAGEYVLTGTDVHFDYAIPFDKGTYALIGSEAALLWNNPTPGHILGVGEGVYAVAGAVVGLRGTFKVWADNVAYLTTGTAAALLAGRKIAAEGATYVLTGVDASTLAAFRLAADPAVYDITGTDTDPGFDWVLSVEAGTYVLAGADASLLLSVLAAEPGVYSILGGPTMLVHGAGGGSILIRRRRR